MLSKSAAVYTVIVTFSRLFVIKNYRILKNHYMIYLLKIGHMYKIVQ